MPHEMTVSWVTLMGLGAFHGINPGMGWLFAVALGMQEGHRRAVEKGYRVANHCLFKEGNPSGDLDGGAGTLLRTYHLYRYAV